MFEGDLSKKLGDLKLTKKLEKQMINGGLDKESRKIIFDGIYNSRQKFVELLGKIREGSTAHK
jgi:hypothetical protein